MFNDSDYIKGMRKVAIQRFDDEKAYKDFKKQYKRQIENGLTKEKLTEHYHCPAAMLEMFDRLKAYSFLNLFRHDEICRF